MVLEILGLGLSLWFFTSVVAIFTYTPARKLMVTIDYESRAKPSVHRDFSSSLA